MKKIARLFVLIGAISFAAAPATSDTWGWCTYSCETTNPPQVTGYSSYMTYEDCCVNRDQLCLPGETLRGVAFNQRRC